MIALLHLIACTGVVLASSSLVFDAVPPLFNITATSHYNAGLLHGQLAASRIQGWLASAEMSKMISFTLGDGRVAFQQLQHDNSRAYPQYADELRGIADGSGIALDSVWALNMINELESLMGISLMGKNSTGHCSDIFAVPEGGFQEGFSHGHNEDWSLEVVKYMYFAKYTAAPGADFESCAGFSYPGGMVGWASTWNAHGIYLTQNSVFPLRNRPGSIASAFAQRDAICGPAGSQGLDAVASKLAAHSWSSGASVNLVDMRARRMANVEVWEGKHSVHEVLSVPASSASNYSHFNMYKHLEPGKLDSPDASTVHRQAVVDSLPAPRSRSDIIERLSDTTDAKYPIFRDETITTMILDGPTGRMDVWCCGTPAANGAPIYTWNLKHFFEDCNGTTSFEPLIVV